MEKNFKLTENEVAAIIERLANSIITDDIVYDFNNKFYPCVDLIIGSMYYGITMSVHGTIATVTDIKRFSDPDEDEWEVACNVPNITSTWALENEETFVWKGGK